MLIRYSEKGIQDIRYIKKILNIKRKTTYLPNTILFSTETRHQPKKPMIKKIGVFCGPQKRETYIDTVEDTSLPKLDTYIKLLLKKIFWKCFVLKQRPLISLKWALPKTKESEYFKRKEKNPL